jgi:hypothetical protein
VLLGVLVVIDASGRRKTPRIVVHGRISHSVV